MVNDREYGKMEKWKNGKNEKDAKSKFIYHIYIRKLYFKWESFRMELNDP